MFRLTALIGWLGLLVGIGYLACEAWIAGSHWDRDTAITIQPGPKLAAVRDVIDTEPAGPSRDETPILYRLAEGTGIDFRYNHGASGHFHLAETLGGGVAATDYDRDGDVDLWFIDGGDPLHPQGNGQNRMIGFRQEARSEFRRISMLARCNWQTYGHGCAVGDFDNDGFDDFFVTGYGGVSLWQNLGDGTFEEVTRFAGMDTDRWCATAAFGDLDGDADLDLYVTTYPETPAALPTPYCESQGQRIHCHPHHYPPVADLVFENLGDGRFVDRSEETGVADFTEYGLGVVIADLDVDGKPEIFVANDGDRNLLFDCERDWTFNEVASRSGLSFNSEGQSMGSMGIACADFDGNGYLDLLTTNFAGERNALFSNDGELVFFDRSAGGGLDQPSRPFVGWEAIPLDADGNGEWELFVANGHVTEMPAAPYRQKPGLFRRDATGEWSSVTGAGDYFDQSWHARGATAADVAGDDRPDLIVSHIEDDAALLVNESPRRGEFLQLTLSGTASNRSAITARIVATIGAERRTTQVMRSAGYLSSFPAEVSLSLGDATRIDVLQIDWPSGVVQTFSDVDSRQRWFLREGSDLRSLPQRVSR